MGDVVAKKSTDKLKLEKLEAMLNAIHGLMQQALPRECMGQDCRLDAAVEIRGIDPDLVMHHRPIVLCRDCFKQGTDILDMEKWKGK